MKEHMHEMIIVMIKRCRKKAQSHLESYFQVSQQISKIHTYPNPSVQQLNALPTHSPKSYRGDILHKIKKVRAVHRCAGRLDHCD